MGIHPFHIHKDRSIFDQSPANIDRRNDAEDNSFSHR